MRIKITLRCNECKQRNYNTMKNKKNTPDKLELNKYRSKWFREMRSELKKVVWPTASTTAKNTGTVLLCSLVVGACIWIFDYVAVSAVHLLIGLAG
mgnify:CR=1 FL=1